MARIKQTPDATVYALVLQLLQEQGAKSVTFATLAGLSGLAPATLVQRFGSCAEMIHRSLTHAWDTLDAATAAAISDPATSGKAVPGLLKALSGKVNSAHLLTLSTHDPVLILRAKAWRNSVEAALAARVVTGAKPTETAAQIFAIWQGRLLWDNASGKGFRLGEALKRLL